MFEAVIFDLDGLLVDSEACQLEAWNQYLKPFNVQLDPSEAAKLVDQRDFDNADYLRRRFDLPVDPLTMAEERNEILLKLAEENIEAQPGALELIEMLRDNELRLAVVSAGVREYIYTVTDKLGLEEAFDVIVAGDMIDLSKPNPMPFLACAETFALHPANCLVLDDSRLGVEAALNAGMKIICVPGAGTERWRITGADVVLNSLEFVNMQTLRSIWFEAGEERRPQPLLQPQPRPRSRW
jgi:HAD superfamily hydrolase (TIGR01509 family)